MPLRKPDADDVVAVVVAAVDAAATPAARAWVTSKEVDFEGNSESCWTERDAGKTLDQRKKEEDWKSSLMTWIAVCCIGKKQEQSVR